MNKLLLLDVDGVLTSGLKTYQANGRYIQKDFLDSDWTYIRKLKENGWSVILVTADLFNESVAKVRNIDYIITEEDKLPALKIVQEKYPNHDIYTIMDSVFDLSLYEKVKPENRFCPSDAELYIIHETNPVNILRSGGTGVVENFYWIMKDRCLL